MAGVAYTLDGYLVKPRIVTIFQLWAKTPGSGHLRIEATSEAELREAFEREGLRRAWTEFVEAETWEFRPGYAAVIYDRIGKEAIRAILTAEQVVASRADARAALRRDDPKRYRTMADEEMETRPVYKMYWKAQLCRAYFEELRKRSLDVDWEKS